MFKYVTHRQLASSPSNQEAWIEPTFKFTKNKRRKLKMTFGVCFLGESKRFAVFH